MVNKHTGKLFEFFGRPPANEFFLHETGGTPENFTQFIICWISNYCAPVFFKKFLLFKNGKKEILKFSFSNCIDFLKKREEKIDRY